MRIRWPRIVGTFALLTLALAGLSACAGAPVSLAGAIGGLGGGLGIGLLVLLLSATQPGCGSECLSPAFCLSSDGGRTVFSPDAGGAPDAGEVDAGDGGAPDAGADPDAGTNPDAGAGPPDVARLDVERRFGVPEPDYLARRADERRAMVEDLRRRGVLPDAIAEQLDEV